ncbi:MAG: hypothetical protein R3A45_01015 [Bdellovibrionota bacterium]
MAYVSPSKDVRDQASECEVSIDKYIDIFANQDLFDRLTQIKESKKYKKLKGEEKRLFDGYYKSFLANGLGIKDEKKRAEVAKLKKVIRVVFHL